MVFPRLNSFSLSFVLRLFRVVAVEERPSSVVSFFHFPRKVSSISGSFLADKGAER